MIDSIYNRLLAREKSKPINDCLLPGKGLGSRKMTGTLDTLQRSRHWSPSAKKSSPSGRGGWGRGKDREGQIWGWGHTGDEEEEGLGKAHFPASYSSYQVGPETPGKDMSLTQPWEVCSQILG